MTIWLLALVLFLSLAGLGYRQGAIRVAFSLGGIIIGALLAVPLGGLIQPVLAFARLKNPVLLWIIGPLLVFAVVLCIFKIAGSAIHHKAEVAYKYQMGELRQVLWERLNRRAGLCLGMVNAAAYLTLISFCLYALTYWTVQLALPEGTPWGIRWLNRAGFDLERAGLARVARAVDPLPDAYYDAADIAGLVFQHSLLEARLSRYPGILSLAERPEFQAVAQDSSFLQMRLQGASIKQVWDHPRTKAVLKNASLVREIGETLSPDLQDLRAFLETGRSEKYDSERILGRWLVDRSATVAGYRKARPNILTGDMQKMAAWIEAAYARTVLVAAPDHQAFLKSVPAPRPDGGGPIEAQTLTGEWKATDGGYDLNFANNIRRKLNFEGTRLILPAEGLALVFAKED